MSNGTIDWTDPCAAVVIIREKYYQLLAGGGIAEIQFADRRVRYTQTSAADMLALLNRLEAECALKTGAAPRRFAISLGGNRAVLPGAGT
jgi:hypothetical protein